MKAALRGEENFPHRMTKVLLMDRFHLSYEELMSTPGYMVDRMITYMQAEAEVREEMEPAQVGHKATKHDVREAFALAKQAG